MRIFVAGGTGQVGSRLVPRLLERGDQIVLLTRRPEAAKQKFGAACQVVSGDPMISGPWQDAVASCDAVINLVGENIFAHRWSAAFKELLRSSRVASTQHVVAALQRSPRTASGAAKVLVNSSAIGYYGMTGDEELDEKSPPGSDFLAQACVDWEKAARAAEAFGVRVAVIRTGVVLDKEGGALKKMLLPFKMFMGGKVGSGRQYVSWIHHQDMVGILLLGLDNTQAAGPINATAPQPVTNKDLAKAIGRALHRPSCMPAPGFALRVVLGEVATIITQGQRVLPRRALELGYTFQYRDIDAALKNILV